LPLIIILNVNALLYFKTKTMLNYVCNVCGNTRKLSKATLEVVDGKVRTREALCKCGAYMQEVSKEFGGFPNIRRTEPSLSKRKDRMWKDTKEKLTS
tara:strand:- start:68 stop:358 length:291 start_codon:yes stop_codon:yes gene_type:complete